MNKKNYIYLFTIFIIAAFFRLYGINYGMPFFLVGDEYSLVGGTLKLFELKTIAPIFGNKEQFEILMYPLFIPYLYAILYLPFIFIEFAINSFQINDNFIFNLINKVDIFLMISRVSSAIISSLTVIIIFIISKNVFKNLNIAFFCSLLICFDWLSAITGHFARHWNLSTFIIWVGVLLSIKILNKPKIKYYIYTGIISGLGFGTSYIFGALAIVPVTLSHLFKYKLNFLNFKKLIILISLFLFFVVIFSLLNPYSLERLLFGGAGEIGTEKNIKIYSNSFKLYLTTIFVSNPIISVLSITGIISSFFIKNSFKYTSLLFLFVIFYIFLLSNIIQDEDRYIIAIIPCLAILCGYNLVFIQKMISSNYSKYILYVIIYSMSITSMIPTIFTNKLLNTADTRLQAVHWLESLNIKNKNSLKIASNMDHILFNSTKKSIIEQKELEASSVGAIDRYRLKLNNFRDEKQHYHVINLHKFRKKIIGANIKISFYDYLIKNKYNYVFINYYDDDKITLLHQKLRKNVKIIKKFNPTESNLDITNLLSREIIKFLPHHFFKFNSFGPYIEIYDLNSL